ncbi:hypothetical protein BDV25DRAFT_159025 [Aspergillus avenaceus]|uniref:Uncharacterized protein n=1 Tax=Aspergillus avenaceus TaxID=36643 RepID=A0A5N6TP64_ASPAV|nr:hypothetical protein BDV25DRAFT_159025 [Aspergillus avenaceus]
MALVIDPGFWKRFSRAIHLDEEAKASADNQGAILYSDDWLLKERKKRRRTIICGIFIFLALVTLITAVVVVIWWLYSHNWLRKSSH